ncbi:MAG: hypothetical protein J2P28_12160 [Actinobacteria bacterium]|nr:hypothetical protein [Actinomycetota bacterium]
MRTLPTGWPVRRTPRWVFLAGAVLVLIAVAVSLVHRPSQAERATDMRGFLREVTADIQSCAGGVGESLTALRLIESGQASGANDLADGISVAQQGADNCHPANNELIGNLENYQVPQSLHSFGLAASVSSLVTWAAPDAERVQTDVAAVLSASTPAAKSIAEARLVKDRVTLNAQRAKVYGPINKAIRALAMHASPPSLPG